MGIRVGLIGLGEIHRAHLAGYLKSADEVTIAAVCDADGERAATVGSELGARPYNNFGELFASGEVDAVDIMLPHHLHEQTVASALQAGLHVLVEKPAAPSEQAVANLERQAAERGLMLAVAENTRFLKAYLVVAEILQRGDIGQVEVVRTLICGNETERLGNVASWKGRKAGTLGGVLFDSGAHSFYLLEWLFGGTSSLLASASTRVAESEVEDFAVVVGSLRNGAEFLTEYTFTAEIPWSERLEVYGSKGSIIVDQLADPVVKVFSGKTDWNGQGREDVPYQPSQWKTGSIADEVVDFVRALVDKRPHAVQLRDVRAAMLAIEAAYESLARDSTRVTVKRPS